MFLIIWTEGTIFIVHFWGAIFFADPCLWSSINILTVTNAMYIVVVCCDAEVSWVAALSLQCVGRALRGKTDYGIMAFADKVVCVSVQFVHV